MDQIACTSHTLQSCVIKGLNKIKQHINRFQKLNLFFNSPKQAEHLECAQVEIVNLKRRTTEQSLTSTDSESQVSDELINISGSSLQILRTINECKTRWGLVWHLGKGC